MLAAYYTGHGQALEVKEVPMPVPGPGEALVKVETAALSAFDLSVMAGKHYARHPIILGHEFSGRVMELGSQSFSMPMGTLVAVEPHIYCGRCKFCQSGKQHLCPEVQMLGCHFDGGFAQFTIVPENLLCPVPSTISANEAALSQPFACCVHAMDRAKVRSGDVCLILGCSTIGMMFIRLLRLSGVARIIVSEPTTHRREAALKCGADISVKPEAIQETMEHETGVAGPDVVIECTGRPEGVAAAIALAGRGGRVLVFGDCAPGETIPLEPYSVYDKELSIIGSFSNPNTLYRAVQLLPLVKIGALVTHSYSLADINKAFEAMRSGVGFRLAIHPNGTEH